MLVVLPAERALDQPAALLQRRQEVSLVLVDDVHDLEDKKQLITTSCSIVLLVPQASHLDPSRLTRSASLCSSGYTSPCDQQVESVCGRLPG